MNARRITLASVLVLLCAAGARPEQPASFLYRGIRDVTICTTAGDSISLAAFCKGTPTIIALVYSRCSGICYPFICQLKDGLNGVGDSAGSYRILVLSFDERDTKEDMAAMALTGDLRQEPRWTFGTIRRSEIRTFTSSVGFDFAVDPRTGQLDHPPILIGADAHARVVSILRPYPVARADLWRLYRDIEGEYVPVTREERNTIVRCVTYDPQRGTVTFSWGMLVLYLPVALGAVIVWRTFRVHAART